MTSVLVTRMTNIDHFFTSLGTVNLTTSSENECRSELVYTSEIFWFDDGPSCGELRILVIDSSRERGEYFWSAVSV